MDICYGGCSYSGSGNVNDAGRDDAGYGNTDCGDDDGNYACVIAGLW